MSLKRNDDESPDRSGELNAYETARSASESSGAKAEPKTDDHHMPLFWRVLGGTILSIVALVTVTLFNNMSSSITELRNEVSREREARAELVKKDEFNARVTSVYERIRSHDSIKVELEGMKEKVNTNATALDGVKRETRTTVDAVKKDAAAATDALKKDLAALEVLKERVAALELVRKEIAGIDTLKEKVAGATADLKTYRDDLQKLSAEVEKNKLSDIERKTSRDAQYKQVEESLKELQKGLQDCREKLARLEGAKPAPEVPLPFARPGAARPAAPGDIKPAGGPVEPGTTKPGPPEGD